MVKIRVSCEHPGELAEIRRLLGDRVIKVKVPRIQKGKYITAYMELKTQIRENKGK